MKTENFLIVSKFKILSSVILRRKGSARTLNHAYLQPRWTEQCWISSPSALKISMKVTRHGDVFIINVIASHSDTSCKKRSSFHLWFFFGTFTVKKKDSFLFRKCKLMLPVFLKNRWWPLWLGMHWFLFCWWLGTSSSILWGYMGMIHLHHAIADHEFCWLTLSKPTPRESISLSQALF